MANSKQIPIRLNLDDKEEARAYEYLQNLDKTIYTSYGKAVTAAILNLFDSDKQSEFETDSKPAVSFSGSNNVSEDVNATEIAKALKDEIRNALPELVSATLMRLMQMSGGAVSSMDLQSEKKEEAESYPQLSDAAWGFLDNF